MKKSIIVALMLGLPVLSFSVNATENNGAITSITEETFTLDEMLKYAIEEESLARDNYKAIREKFSVNRPFTRIIKAEEQHIELIKNLYKKYGKFPKINSKINIPNSLEEAYKLGIKAEKENIIMYEKFLAQSLPDDVKLTFTTLKNGAESHLRSFQRNLNKNKKKEQYHGRGHRHHFHQGNLKNMKGDKHTQYEKRGKLNNQRKHTKGKCIN